MSLYKGYTKTWTYIEKNPNRIFTYWELEKYQKFIKFDGKYDYTVKKYLKSRFIKKWIHMFYF